MIKYIKNPTEKMYIIAIQGYPYLIKDIKNPSEKLCLTAVKTEPKTLQFIDNQTEKMCEIAIRHDPENMQYVKNLTMYLYTLPLDYYICTHPIVYSSDPTYEMCLNAVRRNGLLLKYIKNQTRKLCVTAVKENICAVYFVDEKFKHIFKIKKLNRTCMLNKYKEILAVKINNFWFFKIKDGYKYEEITLTKKSFEKLVESESTYIYLPTYADNYNKEINANIKKIYKEFLDNLEVE